MRSMEQISPKRPPWSRALQQRGKEEVMLLMLCALSVPSILPFGIYRLFQHNWLSAAIDLTLVVGMAAAMRYIWRGGPLVYISIGVSVFYSIGMLATVYLRGVSLVYWAYPTMLSIFFVMRPMMALAINSVSLLTLMGILLQQISGLSLFTIAATVVLVNLFACIFSYRTGVQHRELNSAVERDFLTGVGNRRGLDRNLAIYAGENRGRVDSCLLMLDLDHFKSVNDRFGHAAGDQVLIGLCELMRLHTRATDQIFRYGGEEFVVIANGAGLRAAARLAEELRGVVAQVELLKDCPVTVSIGVALMAADATPAEWLEQADKMLYAAKQSGRNAVRVAPDEAHAL